MAKIFGMTLICIFMAFMAKDGFQLFIFLVHVPFIIGAEVYRYRRVKSYHKEILAEQKAKV